MKIRYLTLSVTEDLSGKEVNTLIRRHLGLSGTMLRRIKWLEDGITVDGIRVNVRYRVRDGQTLSVRLSDPVSDQGPIPKEGPLDLLYEDLDLAVVNKAPGILVHPCTGHQDDTIGNFLTAHWLQREEASSFHPVHRLDKGTSGLLVIAKHPFGQEKLKNQLHTGDFERHYLAVCQGCPASLQGIVEEPIIPNPVPGQPRTVGPGGQPSRTHYQVLRSDGVFSLIWLRLETGRTHQIRVHMSSLGCPLTGDSLYGAEDPAGLGRPALHSAFLVMKHPITGNQMHFSAPLPEDLVQLLRCMNLPSVS